LGFEFQTTLAAARAGAEWAWSEIYRAAAPPLFAYIRGHGAADPDDIIAETFLQVVRDLPRFEGDERDFRAWVFTIARHRLVDDWRRRLRRPVHESLESAAELAAGSSPDEDALIGLATQRVIQVLQALTPDQRDVLLLRILGDLTVEETAKVVNRSPGAVKALQRRGLEAIRRDISREGVTI
jgi:RNA polymerase sigma-70 factor (ECF subfamily)